jgi:glycine cleavage system H protein
VTPEAFAPQKLRFAPTHEWVHVSADASGQVATVGVSAFAVAALTDLVYIELPPVGRTLKAGESFGEIESVKAVSDLYSPVSGEIVAVNDDVANHLERLSEDAYGRGWLIKIRLSDESELSALMDHATYEKQCAAEEH